MGTNTTMAYRGHHIGREMLCGMGVKNIGLDVLAGPVTMVELRDVSGGNWYGYDWDFQLRHMMAVAYRDDGNDQCYTWMQDRRYEEGFIDACHAPKGIGVRWETIAEPVDISIKARGLSHDTAKQVGPQVVAQLETYRLVKPTWDQRARHQVAAMLWLRELAARKARSALDRADRHGDAITVGTRDLITDAVAQIATTGLEVRGQYGTSVPQIARTALGLAATGDV